MKKIEKERGQGHDGYPVRVVSWFGYKPPPS